MSWPTDIDPISGFRLPFPVRETLDEARRAIYDHATRPGASLAGLQGPAGLQLYTGGAQYLNGLNRYLRFDAGIEPRPREVAILATARELDNQFIWVAHEKEAFKLHVPAETIDAIKNREPTAGLDTVDALVIDLGRAIWRDHKVSSQLFAAATSNFGPHRTIDLVLLMGNYALMSALISTVDMQLHAGNKPSLPIE